MSEEAVSAPAAETAPAVSHQSKPELEADLATVTAALKALKFVERPDDVKYKKDIERLRKAIDKHTEQLNELREKIDKSSAKGKGEAAAVKENTPQGILRDKIKKIQGDIGALIEESKALKTTTDQIDNSKKSVVEAIKKAKADIPFGKVEDIDREIARLEESIARGADTSVREEKATINKISQLKHSKKLVSEHATLNAQANALEEKRKASVARNKEVSDNITKLRELLNKHRDELTKFNDAAKANKTDIPSLITRRNEVREELNKLYDERKKLADEQNKGFDEWKAYKKDHDKLEKRQKDLQYLIRKIERAEANAAAAANGEAVADDEDKAASPWAQEIVVCNDLINFVNRQILHHSNKSADAPKADDNKKKAEIDPKEKIIGKQAHGEENLFMLGKPKQQKAPKKTDPSAVLNEKVPLSLDTILYFTTVEVAVPQTIGQLENTLKELQEKKAYFESNPPKPEKKNDDGEGKASKKHHKDHNNAAASKPTEGGPKAVDSAHTPTGAWASKKN